MPLSPQIVITPEDIDTKNFAISAVTYTSTTATYTATGHTFSSGDVVLVSDLAPDGYNGTFTLTSVATNTFTVANTTNAAVTDPVGNAFWTNSAEYEYEDLTALYLTDDNDVTELINTNAQVQAAYDLAQEAIDNAVAAAAEAQAATLAAGTAQTTANGKNKVYYSLATPGSTANQAGDIWYQYGSSGTYANKVIAQWSGAGGTSWTSVTVSGLVIANIDAATITTGTITASVGINNPSGNFAVDGATGYLTCTGATITGKVTATDGTFTGKVYIQSGYIGAASTGWNFTSGGYISNNDSSTIFYPTGAANAYAIISNRPIATKGIDCDGPIQTTGTAIISSNGRSFDRNYFSYYNTISAQSITGGYGVDSDWAPNSDNTYNLGQATSAGYGANRRWQRLYSNNTTISTSDARLKTDVSDSPLGLDFITSLRPVNYRWITGRQEVVTDEDGNAIVIGETAESKPIYEMRAIPGQRLHYGFIAQEVKTALDASGVEDFAGWVLDDTSDPDSTQSLSYEQFIAPLVKAVQELTARIQILEGK